MFQTVINAFQSTPPRGGRPVPLGPVIAITDISIHAPARGATYAGGAGSQSVIHFNPRPREGGDYHAYYYHTFQSQISIHAPARGATRLVPDLGQVAVISIHAPARGATSGNKSFLWVYLYFNPRPREGGDPPRLHAQGSGQVFQSTPPRGGRPRDRPARSIQDHFNPRPREGGDSKDAQFYLRIFDKQVELLRFWGKMRGGCLRNPEKDRRFLGKSLANLPEISGHLDFAGA